MWRNPSSFVFFILKCKYINCLLKETDNIFANEEKLSETKDHVYEKQMAV